MKIIITGITGLIGKRLSKELANSFDIIGLTRNPAKHNTEFSDNIRLLKWDAKTGDDWFRELTGEYAIINLAGEPIAGKLWTKQQKEKIISSRINSVHAVDDAISRAENDPVVVIQASATGFYGQHPDYTFTESDDAGKGFLADTTVKWEEAAKKIHGKNIRMPVLRTGVVLSKHGGALPQLLKPFNFLAGGYIGNGRQWLSWIHIQDHIRAIEFLLRNEKADGVYNLTAPEPVRMKYLTKTAGKILRKPSWTRVPGFVLEIFMGQMAKETIIQGVKVIPQKITKEGFDFQFKNINDALNDILR